jgi:MFS transporter, DHA2 family, multidrug resistance protein
MTVIMEEQEYPEGFERIVIVVTAITVSLLQLIDSTIVNVALRQMAGGLGTSTIDIAWVVTSYAISNVIIIPLSGMLSNLFGRRRYFSGSVAIFTLASLMCGLSHSLGEMVFWRFVQGIGGGALMATSQTIIMEAFPPSKVSLAMALYGMAISLGPAFGPFFGGFLTDNYSWHWVFFVNIPFGIVATMSSWLFIKNASHETGVKSVDWLGILWLVTTVGSLQFVLEEGNRYDWFESGLIRFFSMLVVIGGVLFIRREIRIKEPAVDLSLFKNYTFMIGVFLTFVLGAVLVGAIYLFPLFTQIDLGWTAMLSGLSIMPGVFFTTVAIGFVQRMMHKGGNPKIYAASGFVLTAIFAFWMSRQSVFSNWDTLFLPMLLRGFGLGLMMPPILMLSVQGLSGYKLAQGNGITNMGRQLGAAVGVALLNVRITHTAAQFQSNMVSHLTVSDPATMDRINALNTMAGSNGFAPDQAQAISYGILNLSVTKQVSALSYLDAFQIIAIVSLMVVPLVFLMSRRKKGC